MVDRRTVLFSGLALASAGLPVPLFAQTAFSLDDFLALSARLTGVPAARLDRQAALIIYEAARERGLLPQLARLAAHPGGIGPESQLANEVVAAWYSGICRTADAVALATYTSALLWTSASFLHPPGTCGGATGYWGDPPIT